MNDRIYIELGALGLAMRESQGHEEREAESYEKGHPRRLMHDGKATAYRVAAENIRLILASEGGEERIPRSYWREVPCGHPPDPVAMYDSEGEPVCHCGVALDGYSRLPAPEEAPGPIVHCPDCGCYVAIPPRPDRQPESGEGEDWPEVITAARLWLQEEHGSRRPMADADEAARRLYDALAAIPAPEGSEG